MYKIAVPLVNEFIQRNNRENTYRELQKFGAERVFLAAGVYQTDGEKRRRILAELEDNCRYFRERGYEVGAWLWALQAEGDASFGTIRTIRGEEVKMAKCPLDEEFVAFAAGYLQDVARTGVALIQLDDDFRYGYWTESPGCLCDRHMAAIQRITGKAMTREQLYEQITTGGKNPYRDAWLQVNGDSLRNYAATMRRALDEVDPTIRLGFCTCMTNWDIDGTDAAELAEIMAGNTRPFVRLTGAPYWVANSHCWGNDLQDVVELTRMESAWTRRGDIELFAEGDPYPRPRTRCPASYLEGFDTAVRASGCTDGILKYGLEYNSNADYETGYAKRHIRNSALYPQIDDMFGDKTACGVRVYESMKKVSDLVMPTAVNTEVSLPDLFFPRSARTLAFNSIPTVYEGTGVCGIVFDESARHLPPEALEHGLILDIAAAEILTQRGADVGVRHIGKAVTDGDFERFAADNNHILADGIPSYVLELDKKVEILSDRETAEGVIPMSYRYENAAGQRFLVLNVNTRSNKTNVLRHYARSRQYAETIPWLSGQALPAYVYGNPALYLQCKKNDTAMAVGLWNFWPDIAMDPVVQLDGEYSAIRCLNCTGELRGNTVYLSDIPAFGFAAIEVRR